MTNNCSFSTRRLAWQGKMGAGTCSALLIAVNAPGKQAIEAPMPQHAIPSAPKRSYTPASVRALPGLQRLIYPEGSAPSAGLTVFTDDDGYARFHAVRATAGDKVQPLTLDCKDSAGRPSNFAVDLTFGCYVRISSG
jgi:hypothetical protein